MYVISPYCATNLRHAHRTSELSKFTSLFCIHTIALTMYRFLLMLVALISSHCFVAGSNSHTKGITERHSQSINKFTIDQNLVDKNVTTESPNPSPANSTTLAPSPNTYKPKSVAARTIAGYTVISMMVFVLCWGLWVLRKDLHDNFKKVRLQRVTLNTFFSQ